MRDAIYASFDDWRTTNPWIGSRNIAPKGVVRDLWERAMDFPAFVRHYGLKRSEGVLLRYLTQVYKTLGRAVPDHARTPDVDELIDWLGAVIRSTDSSLLDEWLAIQSGDHTSAGVAAAEAPEAESGTPPITADGRGFRALVRSRVFRWVQYAATGRWEAWSDELTDIGDFGWTAEKLRAQFDEYVSRYETTGDGAAVAGRPDIGTDGDARGPDRFVVEVTDGTWTVEQILADPEGDDEWYLRVDVDLAASDDAGDVVLRFDGVHQR